VAGARESGFSPGRRKEGVDKGVHEIGGLPSEFRTRGCEGRDGGTVVRTFTLNNKNKLLLPGRLASVIGSVKQKD